MPHSHRVSSVGFIESELNFLKITFRSELLSFLYNYSYKDGLQEWYELLENSRIVVRIVRPWHRLAREAMDASPLAVFKARLDGALNNSVKWKVPHGERVVFKVPSSPNRSMTLWYIQMQNALSIIILMYIHTHTYRYVYVCVHVRKKGDRQL